MNCLQVYGKQVHDERLQQKVIQALKYNITKQYKHKEQISDYIAQ